ncbi:MAG: ATP-grasp domain-containing protein [Candidatus Bathyarchaeota archaeon]|nr:ATP-grasp domain-containing protein [Candidatus Bathyarchaeota archaeon]
MHILLYEHISSGGLAGEDLSASVLCEGFAMLNTAAADFQAAGHSVTALVDSRLVAYGTPLKTKNVLVVSTKEAAKQTLLKAANEANAALVIAPESDKILSSIVRQLEDAGLQSLNCSPAAIEKVANKSILKTYTEELGLPIPETLILSTRDTPQKIATTIKRNLQFPVVFKPSEGTSCSGLSIVNSSSQIVTAINKIKKASANKHFIVQQFVEGVPASVSVISNGHQALPISLNRQSLILEVPEGDSMYSGGELPLESDLKEKAYCAAKKIVESIDGLKGYIGVDLILTSNTALIVDVNPRLTTSYVGLQKIARFNIAQAILDAVLNGDLPKNHTLAGYSCFSKITLPKPHYSVLSKIFEMSSIVSPPFLFPEVEHVCAILEAHEMTLLHAQRKLQEVKKQLIQICQGDT